MLVISRKEKTVHDDAFSNFANYLGPGDCLVLNNTRVIPARLHGRRNSTGGAEVEIFLLRPLDETETVWHCLAKPGKRVRTGDRILFGDAVIAEVVSQGDFGERTIRLNGTREMLEQIGEIPLPPYIQRKPDAKDSERYQTVFAAQRGSVAAPTAGLHFTNEMLDKCCAAGARLLK